MVLGQRNDPQPGFFFYVDVMGGLKGTFSECSGLGSESEVIEHHDSDRGGLYYRKIPGRLKWNNISLKRGIVQDLVDVWEWRQLVEEGRVDDARKDGSIVMMNAAGEEVARWNFQRGWPLKVNGPSLNAKSNEVGIEEIEIVHEGLTRDPLPFPRT